MTSRALVMCQETARIARVQDPKVHASHRNRRQGLVWCEKPIPIAIGGKRLIRRPYRFRTTRYDSAEGAYLSKLRRPTCSAPASCSPVLQALQALLLGGSWRRPGGAHTRVGGRLGQNRRRLPTPSSTCGIVCLAGLVVPSGLLLVFNSV